MPNKKTKLGSFAEEPDIERDIAGKGGPAIGPGNPDDKHDVSHPYDEDKQTQLAAKSVKKKNTKRSIEDEE